MRLNLTRKTLLDSLAVLLPLLKPANTLPVLHAVHLNASFSLGRLHLNVTDLDAFATNTCDSTVYESGECCVDAKLLASLLKKLTHDDVTLETTKDEQTPDALTLRLTSGETTLTIPVLDGAEFPPAFRLDGVHEVTLPANSLRQALKYALFCVSTDASRYVLNGVNLSFEADRVVVAATDGRRLSMFPIDCRPRWVDTQTPCSLTVPTDTAKLVLAMLANDEEPDVTLRLAGPLNEIQHVHFSVNGEHTLTSKVVNGTFPNYRQLIPKKEQLTQEFRFPLIELLPAIERAALLADEKCCGVKIAIEGAHATVSLHNSAGIRLIDRLTLAGAPSIGQSFSVCYSASYLLDLVRATAGEYLRMETTSAAHSPGIFSDNSKWQHILMPMSTADTKADAPAADEAEAEDSDEDEKDETKAA